MTTDQPDKAYIVEVLDSNGEPLKDGVEYTDKYGDTWRAAFDASELRLVAKVNGETVDGPDVHSLYEASASVAESSGPLVPVEG